MPPQTELPETLVQPLCPAFGACGGCEFQDRPYEMELEIKESRLRGLFRSAFPDLGEDVFEPVLPSPSPYFYRNRVDITLKRSRGEWKAGFQHASSHKMIEIRSCSIARRELSDFIPQLVRDAIEKIPGDYRTANLVLRTGDDGRIFWGGIGRRSLVMQEKDYLWTEIHGRRIHYSLETFFQANLSILPEVMRKIESLVELDGDCVFYDLYSGVGLFGIYFADRAGKVVMIEENTASARIARFNADYHKYENVEIISGRIEAALPALLDRFGKGRNIAMIDPPRKGLGQEVAECLSAQKNLGTILYLSCNPESLVKDLLCFTGAGWKIEKVLPLDFFPKTRHLETLAVLKP